MVTVKVHGVSTPEGGRMTVVEVFVDNNNVFFISVTSQYGCF